jgi:CubicO group peptidase (beta-lactamase class C family)
MQGEVHDPRAFKLGGIAGHAGLFSTAQDLAKYAQMMLNGGELEETRVLSPITIATMTQGERVPGGIRGLGWDKRSGYSSNRGDLLTDRAFGHGGFTGTVMWIDPGLDLFYIFLSNRVHPNGSANRADRNRRLAARPFQAVG